MQNKNYLIELIDEQNTFYAWKSYILYVIQINAKFYTILALVLTYEL